MGVVLFLVPLRQAGNHQDERSSMRHGNGSSKTSAIFLVLLAQSSIALAMQTDNNVRLNDNSDWWSANNTLKSDASVKIQEREVLLSNFRVLDIDLAEN